MVRLNFSPTLCQLRYLSPDSTSILTNLVAFAHTAVAINWTVIERMAFCSTRRCPVVRRWTVNVSCVCHSHRKLCFCHQRRQRSVRPCVRRKLGRDVTATSNCFQLSLVLDCCNVSTLAPLVHAQHRWWSPPSHVSTIPLPFLRCRFTVLPL